MMPLEITENKDIFPAMIDKSKNSTITRDAYFWTVVVLIITVTALHYFTPTRLSHFHEIFRRLYYIPIIMAAFRFGLKGGFLASLSVGLLYLPHVVFQWSGPFLNNLVRFMEIILFLTVGTLSGLLSRKAGKENKRYREAAARLEQSYNILKQRNEEMARMESELRAADRLSVLGELAASLAHEVRNPLGSMKGAVDILKKRMPRDETSREFFQLLRKEMDRLNTVVDSYLKLARKSRGAKASCHLNKAVESVLALLGPEIRRREIGVIRKLTDADPEIPLSEVEVQQVLLNLLLNALAVLDPGGAVTIQSAMADNKILIHIHDSGAGITPDALKKIFTPFYSGRKGTGLGLSIVKRMVEGAGGTIGVESRPREGTTFTIAFPA